MTQGPEIEQSMRLWKGEGQGRLWNCSGTFRAMLPSGEIAVPLVKRVLAPFRVQIEFTWKKRVRKPCMSEHDCAVRLMFFLEMQKNWFKKVHGFIDQSEFDIPLTQKVRAGDERSCGPRIPVKETRIPLKETPISELTDS